MNMISKGKVVGGKVIRKASGTGPGISLSSVSIVENSAQGTDIATLSPTNASNPGAISIAAQEVANLFQMNVDGETLEVGSNVSELDYETRTSATVTLEYTDDNGTYQFLRTIQITDAASIVITSGGELDTALMRVGDVIEDAWVPGTYPDYNGNTVSESAITYYVDDVEVLATYTLQTGDAVGQAEVTLSATGADDLTYFSGISGVTDFSFTPTDLEWVVPAGGGSVPDQFGTGDWSVADDGTNGDITITLTTLPADNGSSITDLEYRIDGGTATSFGATTTGSYGVSGLSDDVSHTVEVRAVNGNGNGTWSASKSVTPTGVPAAFTAGMWTLTDLTTGGDARIAISSLPADNGDMITDLEYKKDAGAWTSLAGTTTGNYDLAVFTDGVSADVLIRAVNSNGNGPDSDTKSVTTTAADVTAPTLSSPTDAANGSTASTGSVSTNEGNGTLYWVVTTSATSPSAAQVKAGNDHTGSAAADSGSQSVSGTGVQALSPAPSGLTPSTGYFTHFMHEDAATNQSAVSSASGFTTAAASTITFVGSNGTGTTSTTGSMSLTSLSDGSDTSAADGDLVLVFGGRANNGDQTVTMNTSGYTSLGHLYADDTNDTAVELFYKFMTSTPDTTAVINVGATSSNGGSAVCLVFRGVDPTTPFDGVSVVTATGTDGNLADPGAITPATAGAWICAFLAGANNNSASVATKPANMDYMRYASGGGSTRRLSVGGCYFDGWTSGAFDPDAWTGTDNEAGDSWAAFTVALRPA